VVTIFKEKCVATARSWTPRYIFVLVDVLSILEILVLFNVFFVQKLLYIDRVDNLSTGGYWAFEWQLVVLQVYFQKSLEAINVEYMDAVFQWGNWFRVVDFAVANFACHDLIFIFLKLRVSSILYLLL
jgi:hypothetical protein